MPGRRSPSRTARAPGIGIRSSSASPADCTPKASRRCDSTSRTSRPDDGCLDPPRTPSRRGPRSRPGWRMPLRTCRGGPPASPTAGGWRRWRPRSRRISPAGLVYLGYPLHPPGDPAKARVAHLPDVAQPQLFVEGTNDPFVDPHSQLDEAIASCQDATLHWIDGGGHSFEVKGRKLPADEIGADLAPLSSRAGCVSARRRSPACRGGSPQPRPCRARGRCRPR